MQPILVTAPGRSGTTLMMRILDCCADVIVARSPPYEIRLLAYYAYAHRVLTAEPTANFQPSTHPDQLRSSGFAIGFNPFRHKNFASAMPDPTVHDTIDRVTSSAIRGAFCTAVTAYYATLAQQYGRPKAKFFAEKNDNISAEVSDFVDDTFAKPRHILLVRDPRDRYCSHRDYFKSSPEETVAQIVHATERQRREWELRASRPERLMLRYEDIVTKHPEVTAQLITYLGIEVPTLEVDLLQGHGTTESLDRSIGRWRTDLSPNERDTVLPILAQAVAVFGYSPD